MDQLKNNAERTNAQIEAEILGKLEAGPVKTFGRARAYDNALKRLKNRGLVAFEKGTGWTLQTPKAETSATPPETTGSMSVESLSAPPAQVSGAFKNQRERFAHNAREHARLRRAVRPFHSYGARSTVPVPHLSLTHVPDRMSRAERRQLVREHAKLKNTSARALWSQYQLDLGPHVVRLPRPLTRSDKNAKRAAERLPSVR